MLVVSSCTKEEDALNPSFIENKQNVSVVGENDEEIPVISCWADLDSLFGARESYVQLEPKPFSSLSRISPQTAYKYTKESVFRGDQKMMFQKNFADKIGIPSTQVYIACYMKYTLEIPNKDKKQLFENDSPNCGGRPTMNSDKEEVTDFTTFGYEPISTGNPVILATHLLYVKYSFPGGVNYNKYYPRKPADLVWSYFLL